MTFLSFWWGMTYSPFWNPGALLACHGVSCSPLFSWPPGCTQGHLKLLDSAQSDADALPWSSKANDEDQEDAQGNLIPGVRRQHAMEEANQIGGPQVTNEGKHFRVSLKNYSSEEGGMLLCKLFMNL